MGARPISRVISELALVLLYVFGVLLPGVLLIFGSRNAESSAQGGKPQVFPALGSSLESAISFPLRFRDYFAANFGYRERLIRSASRFRFRVLGVSTSADVAVGKDGWLFFTGESEQKCIRRADPFTLDELEHWRYVLESRRDWLAKKGIRYIFVIPPDKHTIYPEYLPGSLMPLSNPSRLEQFVAYMSENSTVEIIDLTPALVEHKTTGHLYHELDTHWNRLGALVAYQQIMRHLADRYPELKPQDIAEFQIVDGERRDADLPRVLGLAGELSEAYPRVIPKVKRTARMVVGEQQNARRADVITELLVYENSKGAPRRLLVMRDSFCTALIPFLSHHFRRSVFVSTYDLDRKLVEEEKPDIVIQEMVERCLMRHKPEWTAD